MLSKFSMQRSDMVLWAGSWASVQVAAFVQLFVMLDVPVTLSSFIVPNVVGLLVGAGLATIASGRRKERALRSKVEHQTAEVRRLNIALTQRVEDRTTELHKRENELLQSQKMEALGRLTGGVAHDFNNLLTGILQGSQLIIEMADDVEATREMAGEVRDTALRAAKLTALLLSLGRRHRVPEPLVPVDLAAVVSDLQPLIVRLMGKRSIVAIELLPDARLILADRTHLEQVLVNLCVNARDAMPDGGTLSVGARHIHSGDLPDGLIKHNTHGAMHLWVRDTGCGIPADLHDKVFNPLFTTKETGVGTGLGLSIVKRLVTGAQGSIQLTSQEGQGARFDVYWPALSAQAEVQSPAKRTARPRAVTGPMQVLVIEDDHSVRDMVARSLRARGHVVFLAANGNEAEQTLDAHEGSLDLILSEIHLPGRAGIELLSSVRERAPESVIVLMTSLTSEPLDPVRLDELGVLGILRKPFDMEELEHLLHR